MRAGFACTQSWAGADAGGASRGAVCTRHLSPWPLGHAHLPWDAQCQSGLGQVSGTEAVCFPLQKKAFMSGGNGSLTLGCVCTRFWKACSHAGSFLFLEMCPWPAPNQSPFFFLCRQRRAVCVGQEYPRVPGNRPPGRPVFPMAGKAGLGGCAGCSQGRVM